MHGIGHTVAEAALTSSPIRLVPAKKSVLRTLSPKANGKLCP